jgi:hypothetical protein
LKSLRHLSSPKMCSALRDALPYNRDRSVALRARQNFSSNLSDIRGKENKVDIRRRGSLLRCDFGDATAQT